MIIVFIPIASQETVSQQAIDSTLSQEWVDHVLIHPTSGYYPTKHPMHSRHIAENREGITDIVKLMRVDYMGMQDSWVCHKETDNYRVMKEHLDEHPQWGGVALCIGKTVRGGKREKEHTKIDCVLIRTSILRYLQWNAFSGECNCKTMSREIRRAGYNFGYLSLEGGRLENER